MIADVAVKVFFLYVHDSVIFLQGKELNFILLFFTLHVKYYILCSLISHADKILYVM